MIMSGNRDLHICSINMGAMRFVLYVEPVCRCGICLFSLARPLSFDVSFIITQVMSYKADLEIIRLAYPS